MTNEHDTTPITDKFLSMGDLFGLRFSEGLIFFEVDQVVRNQYKPYNIGNVASGSSTQFEVPETPDGDSILGIDSRTAEKVIHAGVGHNPYSARRYTNYPEGETRLRSMPNQSISLPKPSNGSLYGYIDGHQTPYENPTDVEELFIPPNTDVEFSFYNPEVTGSEVELNIQLAEYYVNILDPRRRKNKDAIRRILSPGSPIPEVVVGAPRSPMSYSLSWDIEPVEREKIVDAVFDNGGN